MRASRLPWLIIGSGIFAFLLSLTQDAFLTDTPDPQEWGQGGMLLISG